MASQQAGIAASPVCTNRRNEPLELLPEKSIMQIGEPGSLRQQTNKAP